GSLAEFGEVHHFLDSFLPIDHKWFSKLCGHFHRLPPPLLVHCNNLNSRDPAPEVPHMRPPLRIFCPAARDNLHASPSPQGCQNNSGQQHRDVPAPFAGSPIRLLLNFCIEQPLNGPYRTWAGGSLMFLHKWSKPSRP